MATTCNLGSRGELSSARGPGGALTRPRTTYHAATSILRVRRTTRPARHARPAHCDAANRSPSRRRDHGASAGAVDVVAAHDSEELPLRVGDDLRPAVAAGDALLELSDRRVWADRGGPW